jgi:hypothetical protein
MSEWSDQNREMAFNIHNAHQHHRDHSASGFLLVS